MSILMNPLMARFAGEASLVEPTMGGRVESCLHAIAGHPQAEKLMAGVTASTSTDFWQEDGGWCRPYIISTDKIAQIPVKGVLLNNFPYQLYDWATGYEYIWETFKRACGDYATGAVRGIALVIDSPGGMVAGCWDAVDRMVAMKEQTGVPVRAFAHESAYSAAYGVSTVADHTTVSRTGGVGSIGTVTGHLDRSGAMEKAGLVFTYIASDPSKVEGNGYEPLSPDAKARIQVRIDELNAIFVSAVARGRNLEEGFIRDTLKAHSFTATQAVSNGLADAIGTLEDATSAFSGYLDDNTTNDGDENMTTPTTAVDQAALDAATATARAEGNATGITSERTRIGAILASDEAKNRQALANHIAFKTEMSVDDAKAMLAASAEDKVEAAAPAAVTPPAAGPTFENAMDGTPNPNITANGGDNPDNQNADAKDDPSDVLALVRGSGMNGFVEAPAK